MNASQRFVIMVLAIGILVALPQRAWADSGDLGFGASGGAWVAKKGVRPFAMGHLSYGLSDFLSLHGDLGFGVGISQRSRLGAELGVRWSLDILRWVPFLGVSAGVFGLHADSPAWGFKGLLGVRYALDFEWSLEGHLGGRYLRSFEDDDPTAEFSAAFGVHYLFD